MGSQGSNAVPPKSRPPVGKPKVQTDVLTKLREERALRDAEDLNRGFKKTIAHLDEIKKLGDEAYKRKNALLDAAQTGNDPKINELAHKKAQVSAVPKKMPEIECSGGVCRIVRKKKK